MRCFVKPIIAYMWVLPWTSRAAKRCTFIRYSHSSRRTLISARTNQYHRPTLEAHSARKGGRGGGRCGVVRLACGWCFCIHITCILRPVPLVMTFYRLLSYGLAFLLLSRLHTPVTVGRSLAGRCNTVGTWTWTFRIWGRCCEDACPDR